MAKKTKSSPARKISGRKPASLPKKKAVPAKSAARAKARPAAPGKGKPTAAEIKRKLLEHKSAKPIAFSLEEARAVARTNAKKEAALAKARPAVSAGKPAHPSHKPAKPAHPHHIKAASLADILGFNPNKGKKPEPVEERDVPEKFKRYYKLLIELRNHLLSQLDQHTEETLKRSTKEDTGDLSSYGQHMADAGTDTFDRDFALSLVSSEQDALSEIDAAIKRIHDGTYGICEHTGKPIAKDRLLAVPFARHSATAQKELEKMNHRSVQRGGIFADTGTEEGGKIMDEEMADE